MNQWIQINAVLCNYTEQVVFLFEFKHFSISYERLCVKKHLFANITVHYIARAGVCGLTMSWM